MARARLLKPGFFTNEELHTLHPYTRLLFAGLWTIADREGRLEDRPLRIKGELFPYDNVKTESMLAALAAAGFILRFESGGSRYIQILNFSKHQSPNVREPASTIPAPDGYGTGTVPAPSRNQPSISRARAVGSSSGSSSGSSVARVPARGGGVDPFEDTVDPAFGERYSTLVTAFGGNVTTKISGEFTQIAEDYGLEEITAAIRAARSELRGGLLYPSKLWPHLKPVAAPVVEVDEARARGLRSAAELFPDLGGKTPAELQAEWELAHPEGGPRDRAGAAR